MTTTQNKHHLGLDDGEVEKMRRQYGTNQLTPPQKESVWDMLKEKFADPLIIILLVAMVLSLCVSLYEVVAEGESMVVFLEPVGILFAVCLAIGVGFAFELSAKRKFDILNQEIEVQPVKVIRNGNYCTIAKRDVVVGDLVVVEIGDEIPADGLLIESVSLRVNESVLTGEQQAAKTTVEADFAPDATYPSNKLMRGTTVVDGNGLMQVLCVGDNTEYGKVYQGSQIDNKIKTPLNQQLDKLSDLIAKLSYVIAALIVVGRVWGVYAILRDGYDAGDALLLGRYALDTLMIAVTIIVVAVPEGLPMSVSLSLALSMRRMLAANNLVRKMHACETMGAATVICTDKTGTLTQNVMKVADVCWTDDNSDNIIYLSIAVNSTANLDYSQGVRPIGNPTEAAHLIWLHERGVDYRTIREEAKVIAQSSFSTERKYMVTVMSNPDDTATNIVLMKGAPEIVTQHCLYTLSGDFDPMARNNIGHRLLTYQNQAMRTLAFACAIVPKDQQVLDEDGRVTLGNMQLVGVTAIADPVRDDVPEAVRECLQAGIQVKIVTGDTPATAREIGRQIGLWTETDGDENSITGVEFAALSDEAALERVEKIKIMSRARPMDKQRLVSLLQQRGEVVAVTGDGTNDAPALKAAHVGLSMGDGTSVAKQASAITILDNSFKSINRAVLWGRSLYRNIQRFILFQLTINVAACLIVMIGSFTGIQSPLTVTQMLWVNLIMDTFAAMALASLPPEESVMGDKPRSAKASIITRQMCVSVFVTGMACVGVLLVLLHVLKSFDVVSMSDLIADVLSDVSNAEEVAGLTPYESSLFFTFFVMLQFWNIFNAKAFATDKSALSGVMKSRGFLLIVAVIVVGQVLIVTFGGRMFNVEPLSVADWLIIMMMTSVVFIVGEAIRLVSYISKQISK